MDPNGKKLLQFSHFHGPAAYFHGFSLKIQNRHTTPRRSLFITWISPSTWESSRWGKRMSHLDWSLSNQKKKTRENPSLSSLLKAMDDGFLAVASGVNVPWSEFFLRLADVPLLWWAHEIMIGFTVMKPSSINCNNITVVQYLKSPRNGLIILCKFFLLVGEILFHSPRLDRTRVRTFVYTLKGIFFRKTSLDASRFQPVVPNYINSDLRKVCFQHVGALHVCKGVRLCAFACGSWRLVLVCRSMWKQMFKLCFSNSFSCFLVPRWRFGTSTCGDT